MKLALKQLPTISSSSFVANFHQTTNAVLKHGAMLVTRHDQPSMVLVSLERYQQLEQAATPNLATLTQEFDAMYEQMQAPESAELMLNAFAMSPKALGAAALAATNSVIAAK